MSIVVDTSAIIAIMNDEPEVEVFTDIIASAPSLISTASVLEAHCVARRFAEAGDDFDLPKLIGRLELVMVPFDRIQLATAQEAYSRYGRGTGHRASLNMGDCFAYALAKTRNLLLLFKGGDFIHTDLAPAVSSG